MVARDITQSKRAEMTKEVFLTLGAKLSMVRSPVEAARAVFAAAAGFVPVSGAVETLAGLDYRRHRANAFCRQPGRAAHRIVRPNPRRALGTAGATPASPHRRPLSLRSKLARLPGRQSLPGGDFAGAGFDQPAKHFNAGMITRL